MSRLLPYLGSRRLFDQKIVPRVMRLADGEDEYREPFAGGLSTGLAVLHRSNLRGWINDRDPTVASFWWCVRHLPDDLIARIEQAPLPTVDMYQEYRLWLDGVIRVPEPNEIVETAYRRLIVHYMSAHHWGGGVRGGLHQSGAELLTARWNPRRTIYRIRIAHQRLAARNVQVTGFDFARVIENDNNRAICFCDPPFYDYSNNYSYSMTLADHERLADLLHRTSHRWVLTVGDQPEMRRLYHDCPSEYLGFNNLMIWSG